MRSGALWFLFVALAAALEEALAVQAASQSDVTKADTIVRAMQAAPPSIARNATIIDTDATILKRGSNGWRCTATSGPGSTHPSCNDAVWVQFMDALDRKSDFKTDRVGISYMLAGDDDVNNADPFDTHKDPGEDWVQEGPHLMIVVPDPTMLAGVPDDPRNGGQYVMWRGTPYAHIMVPIGSRASGR